MSNIYYVKIGDHNWVKSYAGRHTSMFSVKIVPDQIRFHEMLTKRGVIHGIARSVADATKIVKEGLIGYGF